MVDRNEFGIKVLTYVYTRIVHSNEHVLPASKVYADAVGASLVSLTPLN